MPTMTHGKALMKVAQAQRAMLVLTKQLLAHDQLDGLAAAEEAKLHSEVYLKLRDKWLSNGWIDQSEAEAADKAAGYKVL